MYYQNFNPNALDQNSQLEQTVTQRKLIFTSKYERSKTKLVKRNTLSEDLIFAVESNLIFDPFHPQLKTHALVLSYKGYYASSLNLMYRILWYFDKFKNIILSNIGPHDGSIGVY
jgi:mRNA-degrading endonuclease YafQ of YafQ-DinJ toxin-antitoxin module